jgi:hypothetical protein
MPWDRGEVLLVTSAGQAPPLHLPVPWPGVGWVEQVHGRRLPFHTCRPV